MTGGGAVLHLRVYEQFFNAIASGAKTTEYREMTAYWMGRLVDTSKYAGVDDEQGLRDAICRDPDVPWRGWGSVVFHCGGRTLERRIASIAVFPGYRWFAIRLVPEPPAAPGRRKTRGGR